jgi:hypothetical protein
MRKTEGKVFTLVYCLRHEKNATNFVGGNRLAIRDQIP